MTQESNVCELKELEDAVKINIQVAQRKSLFLEGFHKNFAYFFDLKSLKQV